MRQLLKHRTVLIVATALCVVVWANGLVPSQPRAAAQTSPQTTAPPGPPAGPSGPAAPAGFTDTVTQIYSRAVSYAGLPGKGVNGAVLQTSPPMSADGFKALLGRLTPDELNQLYDYNPEAWPRVDGALGVLTKKAPPSAMASAIGQAYAATPSPSTAAPTPAPALAPGGADYTPPDPELYTDANCPVVLLGGDDGYDLLFASQEAHDIAALFAHPLYGSSTPAAAVVAVLIAVAAALEIPALTTNTLINTGTFCATNNQDAELDVMNRNMVAFDNTSIALVALDQQIQTLEGQVNQLLDTRTQTVVTQLNTAQASLDKAQKQAIEESLQGGGGTAIASYELPASLGGYLDSSPIGVKAIVTEAFTSLQQANQSINPTATKSLNQGNDALAAGQYKQAFFYYQAAYQALTK